jgi:hypothetical protein
MNRLEINLQRKAVYVLSVFALDSFFHYSKRRQEIRHFKRTMVFVFFCVALFAKLSWSCNSSIALVGVFESVEESLVVGLYQLADDEGVVESSTKQSPGVAATPPTWWYSPSTPPSSSSRSGDMPPLSSQSVARVTPLQRVASDLQRNVFAQHVLGFYFYAQRNHVCRIDLRSSFTQCAMSPYRILSLIYVPGRSTLLGVAVWNEAAAGDDVAPSLDACTLISVDTSTLEVSLTIDDMSTVATPTPITAAATTAATATVATASMSSPSDETTTSEERRRAVDSVRDARPYYMRRIQMSSAAAAFVGTSFVTIATATKVEIPMTTQPITTGKPTTTTTTATSTLAKNDSSPTTRLSSTLDVGSASTTNSPARLTTASAASMSTAAIAAPPPPTTAAPTSAPTLTPTLTETVLVVIGTLPPPNANVPEIRPLSSSCVGLRWLTHDRARNRLLGITAQIDGSARVCFTFCESFFLLSLRRVGLNSIDFRA